MFVGEELADGRLRARLGARDRGAHGAQTDQAQDLRLDVERRELLAHGRIGAAPALAHERQQVLRVRTHAPQRATARQRDALVAERHLGEAPAPVDLADQGVFGVKGGAGFARSADWRIEADRILAAARAKD